MMTREQIDPNFFKQTIWVESPNGLVLLWPNLIDFEIYILRDLFCFAPKRSWQKLDSLTEKSLREYRS